jgi:hypothetical protein
MKHAARVKKSVVKYSRRPKIASKSPHRNILLSIFALIALVVGIYIFTSGTFTKNQASLKAIRAKILSNIFLWGDLEAILGRREYLTTLFFTRAACFIGFSLQSS